jgi:hypothetical protein
VDACTPVQLSAGPRGWCHRQVELVVRRRGRWDEAVAGARVMAVDVGAGGAGDVWISLQENGVTWRVK